ncbi:hypothetical protein BJ912DRAFT_936428 [Pholiota molesta]|nr:hypothetical protein BJ912DRAFT_936428 [Pholiota molesta]
MPQRYDRSGAHQSVEGGEWTGIPRTAFLAKLKTLEMFVNTPGVNPDLDPVSRADFDQLLDHFRITTAGDPVMTPWGEIVLVRLRAIGAHLTFAQAPIPEDQQTANGEEQTVDEDTAGAFGESMEVDREAGFATDTAAPSTADADAQAPVTTAAVGRSAWDAPSTANAGAQGPAPTATAGRFDWGAPSTPTPTSLWRTPEPAGTWGHQVKAEVIASSVQPDAGASEAAANRSRAKTSGEPKAQAPASSKGKGKMRAPSVVDGAVPKTRALVNDYRGEPPKAANFVPGVHEDAPGICDYCNSKSPPKRCFHAIIQPQGVYKCTNCRRDKKKCSHASKITVEVMEVEQLEAPTPPPARAPPALQMTTPAGDTQALSAPTSPRAPSSEFQQGSSRRPSTRAVLSVEIPPLPDSYVRMGPHRLILPSYPDDPSITDRLACTLSYLRGAYDEQKERIKWVERFRREMKIQCVTGQTHSINFIDHSHKLVAALQADSRSVDIGFAQALFEMLMQMRDFRASALVGEDSGAIEYNDAFWAMVDMVIESLARLGFGGD